MGDGGQEEGVASIRIEPPESTAQTKISKEKAQPNDKQVMRCYLNRAQWLILWLAWLLVSWLLLPRVFSPDAVEVIRQGLPYERFTYRLVALVAVAALLLTWQASRWSKKKGAGK